MIDTIERPKTERKIEWLPVIFANGEDDDTPGFAATFADEKFQYGERVYKRGEDFDVDELHIVIDRRLDVADRDGRVIVTIGTEWPEDSAIRVVMADRRIHIGILNVKLRGGFYL